MQPHHIPSLSSTVSSSSFVLIQSHLYSARGIRKKDCENVSKMKWGSRINGSGLSGYIAKCKMHGWLLFRALLQTKQSRAG